MFSVTGILLSLILTIICVTYSVHKFDILIGRKEDDIYETLLRRAVSIDETFKASDGLAVAFGLYSVDKEPIDESYGHFNPYFLEWGLDQDGN